MASVKYFRLVGRWRGFTKDDKTDVDEDPQFKGVNAGVTITASTTKNRQVMKAATLTPYASLVSLWPIEARLDDGRLKVFSDSENPAYDQPDVRFVANCPALSLDSDEQLIYTLAPHDATANGGRVSLPSMSFVAPFIPEDHDDLTDGEIVLNWAQVEWLQQGQLANGGTLVRNVPDDVTVIDGDLQFLANGSPLGERLALPVRLANYMRPSSTTLYPPSDLVSYSVSAADPVYAGQRHFFFTDADIEERWRFSGTWFDYANNPVNQVSGATASDFNNSTSYEVEFYVNGADVTLWARNVNLTDFKVFVDDAPLVPGWSFTTAGVFDMNYIKIQFASSRVRKIRLLASGFMSFTGVLTPGTSAIWKAPKRFRVAITGDSYVQGGHYLGAQGTLMGGALCNQLAIITGWEVLNLGQGGTGYVNDSGGTVGKSPYGSPSRLAALAALPPLDLFIAFGSGNDSGTATATVLTAANAFWDGVKAARPETPIVVVGVESGHPTGFDPALMSALNTALVASAKANRNVDGVIDMRTDPWWTGTGFEGSPAEDGNADFFISGDGVHPSRAGYEDLANRIADELRAITV